jgi:hypothetical protein
VAGGSGQERNRLSMPGVRPNKGMKLTKLGSSAAGRGASQLIPGVLRTTGGRGP